jgi:hypothetical protein
MPDELYFEGTSQQDRGNINRTQTMVTITIRCTLLPSWR